MPSTISPIIGRRRLSGRVLSLPKTLAALGCVALATHALAAPVVVTPTNTQGWIFADGKGTGPTSSPAAITTTAPYQGNGSIQFDIATSNQQPLAAYVFGNAVRFGDLVNGNATFGFSYMLPVNSPPATSPTIRLNLNGLSNTANNSTFGSLGWYANGAGDGNWHTNLFSMTSGDFFFRVGGAGGGQENLGCAKGDVSGAFDDRRQTLNAWGTQCTGVGTGTVDLDDAVVSSIEVDWGSFSTTFPVSAFADGINFNIGRNVGDYNFEVTDPTPAAGGVPEPASLALSMFALGLAGAATARVRKQNQQGDRVA